MFDNKKKLYCPACGKKMHKIFITSSRVHLDVCLDGCGGIWFDKNEEKFFDEEHENIDEILDALSGRDFQSVNQEYDRICPLCGIKMQKNFTSDKKEVEIDECPSCGGKFFDFGELRNMRDEYPTEEMRKAAMQGYLQARYTGITEASVVPSFSERVALNISEHFANSMTLRGIGRLFGFKK